MTRIQKELHAVVRDCDRYAEMARGEQRGRQKAQFVAIRNRLYIVLGMLVAEDGMRAGRLPMVEGGENR